jgi:SAM-dependent methyltransferase
MDGTRTDGTRTPLKLYVAGSAVGDPAEAYRDDAPAAGGFARLTSPSDPVELVNRELIRPPGCRRATPGLVPFSAAWFDELEQKRYQRHGVWLPAALEFGRHPGEAVLLLGPGLGSDAIRYLRTGSLVTIGLSPGDRAELIRDNLSRHGLAARLADVSGPRMPFPDGHFDVVTWNALYDPQPPDPARVDELFRVLKAGGKVIGLFPARYDAGYWQDLLLPLQWLYWHRPADPTTGAKTSGRRLRALFGRFHQFRVAKRHLRRSELPHPWRVLPLVLLERLLGRVLVFKAFKPLSARSGSAVPLAA